MALLAASVASFELVPLLSIPNPMDFTDIIIAAEADVDELLELLAVATEWSLL